MTLIKCEECGHEISDKVKKCPNCGYKVNKTNKKLLFVIIGIVAIILVSGVFLVLNNRLTTNEKFVVDSIKDYKSLLKNPSSLQVHELNIVPFGYEGTETGAIFLDVSSQNGFGGNNRDIVMYGINENDVVFIGSTEYLNSSDSYKKDMAELVQKMYHTMIENHGDKFNVSVKKIMKHID